MHVLAWLLCLVHNPGPVLLVVGDLDVVGVGSVIAVPQQQPERENRELQTRQLRDLKLGWSTLD